MLVFSKKSWHFRLYELFYGKTGEGWMDKKPPSNLCPYFWKIVLGVLMSPLALFMTLPLWLVTRKNIEEDGIVSMNIVLGLAVYTGLYLVFCILVIPAMFYYPKESFMNVSATIGAGITLIGMVCLLFLGIRKLLMFISSVEASSSPSLIGSYLKAKKNKICPQIKWK